jgi:hypothetical protein
MQLCRAKDQEHHKAIMIRSCLRYSGLIANNRATAITTDHIFRSQLSSPSALTFGQNKLDTIIVLHDRLGAPTIHGLYCGKLGRTFPKHGLCCVLG